jgi:hypothetical protein
MHFQIFGFQNNIKLIIKSNTCQEVFDGVTGMYAFYICSSFLFLEKCYWNDQMKEDGMGAIICDAKSLKIVGR